MQKLLLRIKEKYKLFGRSTNYLHLFGSALTVPTPEELAELQKQEQEKLAAEQAAEAEKNKQTQQTPSPEDLRIKAMEDNFNRRFDQLQQLMLANAQNVQRATVEAPKAPELPTNKEVWDDPVNAISKIVAAQNAPLNKIAQELAGDRKLTQVKAQLKLTPQYKIAVERYPDFESALDYQLSQIPAEQLSPQSMGFVMSSVIGQLAMNTPIEVQKPNNGNPNPSNALPANIPAHLRPTQQQVPVKKPDESEPELNENERILAQRYGMSAKDYKAMQGGDRLVLNPLDVKKGA